MDVRTDYNYRNSSSITNPPSFVLANQRECNRDHNDHDGGNAADDDRNHDGEGAAGMVVVISCGLPADTCLGYLFLWLSVIIKKK